MSDEEFEIRETTEADHQAFINLITENFVSDEPFYRAYIERHRDNYKKDPIYLVNVALRKLLEESLLKTNASLVAITRTSGQFIGSLVLQSTENPNLVPVGKSSCPKSGLRSLLHNITYHLWDIRENTDLCEYFPGTSNHLQLTFLTTHREHRCRGVGTALLAAGVQYAKDKNYDLVYGIFTSYVSKMIARRVALENVYECDLRAVANQKGPVFADAGENNVVAVMAATTTMTSKTAK